MSKCKTSLFVPKRCKGLKPGCRQRRKKHKRFLKASHKKLKMALAEKIKVVKVEWKKHFAYITFDGSPPGKIYCNYNFLRYLLRNRIFYSPAPFVMVNHYFYNEMVHTEEGDFLTGHPNLREKLVGKSKKEIEARTAYLGSDTKFRDARKLSK
jgi:hypothetical protein